MSKSYLMKIYENETGNLSTSESGLGYEHYSDGYVHWLESEMTGLVDRIAEVQTQFNKN